MLNLFKKSFFVAHVIFYHQQEPQEQQVLPLAQAQAQGLILEVRRYITF